MQRLFLKRFLVVPFAVMLLLFSSLVFPSVAFAKLATPGTYNKVNKTQDTITISANGTAWCEPSKLNLIGTSQCDQVELDIGGTAFTAQPSQGLVTTGGADFTFSNISVDTNALSNPATVTGYWYQKDNSVFVGQASFSCTETVTLAQVSDTSYEIRYKFAANHPGALGPWPQRYPCRPS